MWFYICIKFYIMNNDDGHDQQDQVRQIKDERSKSVNLSPSAGQNNIQMEFDGKEDQIIRNDALSSTFNMPSQNLNTG